MRRRVCILAGGLALLTLSASPPRRSTLTVFAAASLANAFNDLADTLKHRQPDLKIEINYAGSQALALQIEQGAAADIFASADDRWMSTIRDSGLVAGTPQTFVRNRLVVIVPKNNPGHIQHLQDLARDKIKLVLAADAVPAGRYARVAIAALSHAAGFPVDFADRVLRNVVSNEDNVKGVAAKVQLGEADAGIVYFSDVTPAVQKFVNSLPFPSTANVVASYPIAILRHAVNPAAAHAFVSLVLSPTGQAVLARNGFIPLEAPR